MFGLLFTIFLVVLNVILTNLPLMPNMELPPLMKDVVIYEKPRQRTERAIRLAQIEFRPQLKQQEIQDMESTMVIISAICAILVLGSLVMKILQKHRSRSFHQAHDNILCSVIVEDPVRYGGVPASSFQDLLLAYLRWANLIIFQYAREGLLKTVKFWLVGRRQRNALDLPV